MHGEYLLINDRGDRKTIEAICESLPELDIVPSLTLVVKSINTIDGGALMISTQYEKILGVFDLVSEQQAYSF